MNNSSLDAMLPGDTLKDDKVPGLQARRHASGTSFLFYYRTRQGVVRRPKIGEYPTLSLANARKIANNWLVQVAEGKDPSLDNQNARTELTMDDLWARVERDHYNRGKQWDKDAKRLYTHDLSPRLGKKRVSAVSYDDIATVYAGLKAKPILANRVVAVFGKMMKLAERWKYRPPGSNPVGLLDRYSEKSRDRFASPEELKRIGAALDANAAEDPAGVAFLYVLAFSGARPSEIGRATPDMVDAAGVLRIAEGKTGKRAVFLPAQALSIIAKLPTARKNLCGRSTVPKVLWKKIKKEAKISADLWARDFRRAFATTALSSGVPIGVVGELLGHKSQQTTMIYAKLIETKAHEAAAGVGALMEGMMNGGLQPASQAGSGNSQA